MPWVSAPEDPLNPYWVDDTNQTTATDPSAGYEGPTRTITLSSGKLQDQMWVPPEESSTGVGFYENIGSAFFPPSGGGGGGGGYTPGPSIVNIDSTTYPGYDIITWSNGNQTERVSQAPAPTPITDISTKPIGGTNNVAMYDQNGNYVGMGTASDPNVTSITTQPIPGTDSLALYDQNGNYIGTGAASKQPTYYDPAKLPSNLVPIYDMAGNAVAYENAPKTTDPQAQANWQANFNEGVRQFDASLARGIAQDQARLAEIGMEQAGANARAAMAEAGATTRAEMAEAGADRRQAAALAEEAKMLQTRIASAEKIAQMDIDGRWRLGVLSGAIDVRGQNVAMRGQDVTMRGQDVTREGNILQAQEERSRFAIQALGNDPIRQAIYLTGGSGGTTPLEQYASVYELPALPSIGSVGGLEAYAGGLDPNIAKGFAGGGKVIPNDRPVLGIVGESNPSAAEAFLTPAGSELAVEPLRLGKNASKKEMEMAALRAYPRLQKRLRKRLASMQGGGAVEADWRSRPGWENALLPPLPDVLPRAMPPAPPVPSYAGDMLALPPPTMPPAPPVPSYAGDMLALPPPTMPPARVDEDLDAVEKIPWAEALRARAAARWGASQGRRPGRGGYVTQSGAMSANPDDRVLSSSEIPKYIKSGGGWIDNPAWSAAHGREVAAANAYTPENVAGQYAKIGIDYTSPTDQWTPSPAATAYSPQVAQPSQYEGAGQQAARIASTNYYVNTLLGAYRVPRSKSVGAAPLPPADYTRDWQNLPAGWTRQVGPTGVVTVRSPTGQTYLVGPDRPPPWAQVVAMQYGGAVTEREPGYWQSIGGPQTGQVLTDYMAQQMAQQRAASMPQVAQPSQVDTMPPAPPVPSYAGDMLALPPPTKLGAYPTPQSKPTPMPTATPPAPLPLMPEDVLLYGGGGYGGWGGAGAGTTFTNQAALEAARATVAEQLWKANAGYTQPAYMGLPAPESLYGVTLRQPGQMAARFWQMPKSLRDLYVSGWGVREMPKEELYRQMAAVTPRARNPFNVAYGQRGLAVLPPMRRLVAA